MHNVLKQFEEFCKTPEIDSGKARSYAYAIQYLCDYLKISVIDDNSVAHIKSIERDINNKESLLYKDMLIFLSNRRQKSYLEKGFIKASLKYFYAFYNSLSE